MGKEYRINEEIQAREVRLVDAEGQQLGVVPLQEALRIAQEQDQDLVEVSPQGNPPVCRVMDFGKFKFAQSKKDKEVRKKQKFTELKEVKLRPKIDVHDFTVKSKMVQRLLGEGDKVKVTIMFRGREVAHANQGEALLKRVAAEVSELAVVERQSKLEGRNMIMILAPKTEQQKPAPSGKDKGEREKGE